MDGWMEYFMSLNVITSSLFLSFLFLGNNKLGFFFVRCDALSIMSNLVSVIELLRYGFMGRCVVCLGDKEWMIGFTWGDKEREK